MSIEQDIREEGARGVAADVRDARIEVATDSAMKVITAVELMNALTEVDVSQVEQGTFKAGSVEDFFNRILLAIRQVDAPAEVIEKKIGEAVGVLVWINHRDLEVEPFIDD
jgi:hypothetical protein